MLFKEFTRKTLQKLRIFSKSFLQRWLFKKIFWAKMTLYKVDPVQRWSCANTTMQSCLCAKTTLYKSDSVFAQSSSPSTSSQWDICVTVPRDSLNSIIYAEEPLCTGTTLYRNHFAKEQLCSGTSLHRSYFAQELLLTGTTLHMNYIAQEPICRGTTLLRNYLARKPVCTGTALHRPIGSS